MFVALWLETQITILVSGGVSCFPGPPGAGTPPLGSGRQPPTLGWAGGGITTRHRTATAITSKHLLYSTNKLVVPVFLSICFPCPSAPIPHPIATFPNDIKPQMHKFQTIARTGFVSQEGHSSRSTFMRVFATYWKNTLHFRRHSQHAKCSVCAKYSAQRLLCQTQEQKAANSAAAMSHFNGVYLDRQTYARTVFVGK